MYEGVTSSFCARLRAQHVVTDPPPTCPQITVSGSGSTLAAVGGGGFDAARGTLVAWKGGGAGSAQVRALALETLDSTGVRR